MTANSVLTTNRALRLRLEAQMAEHVEAIGRRIRKRREALGMTQAELARKLSGNPDGSQVSRWERGEHEPGPERKEEIARALKTTVATFLSDPPKKTETPKRPLSADDSERLKKIEKDIAEILRRLPAEPAREQKITEGDEGLDDAEREAEQTSQDDHQSAQDADRSENQDRARRRASGAG